MQPDTVMFPLFATGVVDTGGNLPPVLLTPAANSPLVSSTMVAKFAAGVVDTGGKLIPVVHLDLWISLQIFKKIWNGPNGIVPTKLIHEKNQKQKVSRHCPLKEGNDCILLLMISAPAFFLLNNIYGDGERKKSDYKFS
jgi:hypothetical protein